MQRCYNENHPRFYQYGGRGIKVCEIWHNIGEFIFYVENNLGKKPDTSYSLDRINNDKNYEPGNIKWSSASDQANNRRTPITNTSGYMGVTFDKIRKKWVARVTINGSRVKLGRFKTKEQAALAVKTGK